MRLFITLTLYALLLSGCVVNTAYMPVSTENAAFLRNIWENEKTDFTLPNDDADLAWRRAQFFAGAYSPGMKHDYGYTLSSLSSYDIPSDIPLDIPGFSITRLTIADSTRIYIKHHGTDPYSQSEIKSKLIAHYLKTGYLPVILLNSRLDMGQILNPNPNININTYSP